MRPRHRERNVNFDVQRDVLVRTVTFSDGSSYTHRCERKVYEEVAHYIDRHGEGGVTLDPLAEAVDAPHTQVNVALEFLKERGCVVTEARRNYPASMAMFEDAMVEFCYLAEAPY